MEIERMADFLEEFEEQLMYYYMSWLIEKEPVKLTEKFPVAHLQNHIMNGEKNAKKNSNQDTNGRATYPIYYILC